MEKKKNKIVINPSEITNYGDHIYTRTSVDDFFLSCVSNLDHSVVIKCENEIPQKELEKNKDFTLWTKKKKYIYLNSKAREIAPSCENGQIKGCSAIVIVNNKFFVLVNNVHIKGLSFVGGSMLEKEEPIDCIYREIYEETSIKPNEIIQAIQTTKRPCKKTKKWFGESIADRRHYFLVFVTLTDERLKYVSTHRNSEVSKIFFFDLEKDADKIYSHSDFSKQLLESHRILSSKNILGQYKTN